MKINELSKELGIKNKDLITYLREAGFSSVSSHVQVASEDMIAMAHKHFDAPKETVKEPEKEIPKKPVVEKPVEEKPLKQFKLDDMIPCRSVTPYGVTLESPDKTMIYRWKNWGDVEMVRYKDLQSWRRNAIVTNPMILIEDADLVEQWKRDIGDIYKPFIGVEYPEELFDLSDDDFENLLRTGSRTVKQIIATVAMTMIRAENYPDVRKLRIIDDVLGTMLMQVLR